MEWEGNEEEEQKEWALRKKCISAISAISTLHFQGERNCQEMSKAENLKTPLGSQSNK